MDNAFCLRALYAVCVHMAHNIVTYFFFSCLCNIIIDVICMGFQLVDLLLCNI